MNKFMFTIIGVAFMIIGCQRQEARIITEDDFPNVAKLKAEEITFDRNRYDVFYTIDSILIAFNALADEDANSDGVFLDAYKLPSLDYLGPIARHGRGPGEFLFAEYEDNNYYYEDGELKILVFDQLRNTASIINLSQTIEQHKTVVEKEMKFSIPVLNLYLRDMHTLLLQEQKFRQFYLYDVAKKEYTKISSTGSTDWTQLHKHSCELALFPGNNTKALLHYRSINRTSVHEISKDRVLLRHGPYSIFSAPSSFGQDLPRELKRFIYNDIRIRDDNVYCLYMNQTQDEIYEALKPVEIHRFDEYLNPTARYSIDECIRFFAVDYINKTIYGVTVEDKYHRYILP